MRSLGVKGIVQSWGHTVEGVAERRENIGQVYDLAKIEAQRTRSDQHEEMEIAIVARIDWITRTAIEHSKEASRATNVTSIVKRMRLELRGGMGWDGETGRPGIETMTPTTVMD